MRHRAAAQLLTGYRFEEEVPAAIYSKAFKLMKKFKVSFYDAAYHAVAINRSGTMLTADDMYFCKALRAGHHRRMWDVNRCDCLPSLRRTQIGKTITP